MTTKILFLFTRPHFVIVSVNQKINFSLIFQFKMPKDQFHKIGETNKSLLKPKPLFLWLRPKLCLVEGNLFRKLAESELKSILMANLPGGPRKFHLRCWNVVFEAFTRFLLFPPKKMNSSNFKTIKTA